MADETAWMIEWPAHNGHPMRWWAGVNMGDDGSSWTTDPNLTVRFCREDDARRTAASLSGFRSTEQFRFTEHMWIGDNPPPMTSPAPDYAKLVEELNNFADTLDNDAEDARAAEAEEAQANAEDWAALQRTSAAAITALVRERDALNEYVTLLQENGRIATQRVAAARAAALEEAAQLVEAANVPMSVTICESEAERLADNIIVGRLKQGINIARFHLAAAIRALAKPAPLP